MQKNIKSEQHLSGFTLVEIAIVVVMIGLAGFAIANTYSTLGIKIRQERTALNFSMIEDALSAYAQRNMRLPCPMRANFNTMPEPYGYESGSGGNGGNIPANCPVLEGIVPFATLGLDDDVIRDGYGHFITYRIARSHGRDPNIAANVHANCRSTPWVETDMSGANVNINPQLARFCCRAEEGGANDLDIEIRPFLGAGPQNVWRFPVDNGAARYNGVNTPTGAYPSNAVNRNTIRPIYVLVSHGPDGRGAVRSTGIGGRNPGFLGNDEAINANIASSRYRIGDTVLIQNSVNYFDDYIAWGTQDSLLARGNKYSCHAPTR